MTYNKKRHQELVMRSLDLEHQGKALFNEDDNAYTELIHYNIAVEEYVFWTHRENFISIMKDFIIGIIDFDEFKNTFSQLYSKTTKELDMFKKNLEQIEKFQPSTRPYSFASAVIAIYRKFDDVIDEDCTEQDLMDYVKKTYLEIEIQNFLNEE